MSKWREIYGKKHTTNNESDNNINVKDDYIKTEPADIKNEEQEEYSQQIENNINTEMTATNFKVTNVEGYYPTTTDKAWQLAEKLLTGKSTANRKLLLIMAKKYKDTPNADFIKFYNDNGTLLIENAPSPKVNFNYGDIVQVSYFVRDFKTGALHFPKTTDEAWDLVKNLFPKELVEKATR